MYTSSVILKSPFTAILSELKEKSLYQNLLEFQENRRKKLFQELVRGIPYSTLSSPPPLCLVPPPPVSLGKSWSLTISLKKNYIENFRIWNYFIKDFLNFSFHYVRYCNHLVTFLEKFSYQFTFFQALNEVSQSNIFLVFFC